MAFNRFPKRKIPSSGILLILILISVVHTVHADWSDNFDDGDISDWDQFASSDATPSWEVNDGKLLSANGTAEVNYLCKPANFKYGNVTIDLYYESDLRSAVVSIGRNGANDDSMFLHVSGSNATPNPNTVGFVHRFITGTDLYNIAISDVDVEGWHTYSIIRSDSSVELYVDGQLVVTAEFDSTVDTDYDQFCLSAWQDGVVGFDNLVIQDENTPFFSLSNPTFQYILYSIGAIAIIALSVIIYGRHYFQKNASKS